MPAESRIVGTGRPLTRPCLAGAAWLAAGYLPRLAVARAEASGDDSPGSDTGPGKTVDVISSPEESKHLQPELIAGTFSTGNASSERVNVALLNTDHNQQSPSKGE